MDAFPKPETKYPSSQFFVYFLSLGSLVILILLMFDLSATIDQLAINTITEIKNQTKKELDNFFNPAIKNINIAIGRGEAGFFDNLSLREFDLHFIPYIQNSNQISSILLAQANGDEKMLLQLNKTSWVNRQTFKGSVYRRAIRYKWKYQNGILFKQKTWNEKKDYDPRIRPWYKGAIKQAGSLSWSNPYIFFTTKDPGITVSRKWVNKKGQIFVFGFDLLLMDISRFTSTIKVGKNGKVFILTADDRVLGLPNDTKFQSSTSLKQNVLKKLSEIDMTLLMNANKTWNESNTKNEPFSFDYEGDKWWGSIRNYPLGQNDFKIGVIVPESDYLSAIQETRLLIFGGFVLIIFFTFIIIKIHRKVQTTNALLVKSNIEIEEKKEEILDSINYAQRIQNAILPAESHILQYLPSSFVFYQPKDIVAGDFYWMEIIDNEVLIAAADCTGHGVPGAMVSVVCHNSLNRAVKEFGIVSPAAILDKTTQLVIETFSKSDSDVKDGMDIAICKISLATSTIEYAGANNSLCIIHRSSKELEEIKADKQPVGKFAKWHSFTNHTFCLSKGDILYMYSDGFADQFGGPKGKKFNNKKFREMLCEISSHPMHEQADILKSKFDSWIQTKDEYGETCEQLDDLCIIGIQL